MIHIQQIDSADHLVHDLEASLRHFKEFLEHRRKEIMDCELEIHGLSNRFEEFVQSWFHDTSGFARGERQDWLHGAYVLNCPELHVVPAKVLESLVMDEQLPWVMRSTQ